MEIEKIEKIIGLMERSSLTELSLIEGEGQLTLKRTALSGELTVIKPEIQSLPQTKEEDAADLIESPMVGTFYNAPSPDAAPFVKVGDIVKKGQVLCIIEAMKLMNEVECECDAEVTAVLAGNEQKVEYGQPLFQIKKL
jgi:acetyl-CoA carboxylase biotin carboxyl carrier protein